MVNNAYNKNIRRTILRSMGRYIAILAIVALGVGFFAGVKDTKASMVKTCNKYVSEHNLYDYRLVSTWGFTEEDEKALSKTDGVKAAEGSVTMDFLSFDRQDNSIVLRAHSITKKLNGVNIEKGRMPQKANECVADDHFYNSGDIGKKIKVADENSKDTKENLAYDEYTITGIINSPCYLMKTERGTGTLGDGRINAYIYIPGDGFKAEYYTEMFLTCRNQGYIYSEEYDNNIADAEEPIKSAAEERGRLRYEEVIEEGEKEIEKGRKELEDGEAELQRQKTKVYAELNGAKKTLDDSKIELESGKKELISNKEKLMTQKARLEKSKSEGEAQLEALKNSETASEEMIAGVEGQLQQLEAALIEINAGLDRISDKERETEAGERQLNSGYNEYYSGKAAAEARFASAERELENGRSELKKAEKELSEVERPELFIQTRDDNIGYDSFDSNSDIVDSIAKIFPVFFFLIAALVCSTTMSRMIEEERTQIGVMRALGYTREKIMWKYMLYSGSAAVIGCIAGFLAGSKYFPYAIWIAYGMMFGFADLEFYFSWPLALISLIVAVICSVGTTFIACRGQLKHTPAEILRPSAPKSGKRILLEKITPLWSRLKFLHKVTARNVFRYKKRMIMMVMGIGGCTALVIAGFGIHDSVAGMAEHQYSEVEKYDMTVGFSQELTEKELERFDDEYGSHIKSRAVLQQTAVTVTTGNVIKSCSLMVSGDKNITKEVSFKSKDEDEYFDYPQRGEALITNKLAEMLGVKKGDKITIKYDDTKSVELKVSGVYKNYVNNYIYISEETYVNNMQKDYEPSVAFVTFKKGEDVYEMSSEINKFDDVAGVSVNLDIKKRVNDMMVSLNYIIILVIGCAGALAFIVLFNLSNINITEREREIATIEVLGFYPSETGAYVFRENFVLVILGIIVGMPAGFALHKFIMTQIVVDAVSFNEVIEPQSFVFAALIVIMFSVVVDLIMRRKLKRINMAEALKSTE